MTHPIFALHPSFYWPVPHTHKPYGSVIFLFTWQASLCRFNKLKLTNSNQHTLRTLDTLGENHDSYLIKTRERISKENAELHLLDEKIKSLNNLHATHLSSALTCNCNQQLSALRKQAFELEKSTHPGFVISFDNLDIQLQRKNMSMQSQNRDYHWVNHQMIENRVSGAHLNSKGPKTNLQAVSNLKFLPKLEDQQRQRSNYIILAARILVDYFDALAPLKDACILHIPHKYTNEMAQKSKKVVLFLIC